MDLPGRAYRWSDSSRHSRRCMGLGSYLILEGRLGSYRHLIHRVLKIILTVRAPHVCKIWSIKILILILVFNVAVTICCLHHGPELKMRAHKPSKQRMVEETHKQLAWHIKGSFWRRTKKPKNNLWTLNCQQIIQQSNIYVMQISTCWEAEKSFKQASLETLLRYSK